MQNAEYKIASLKEPLKTLFVFLLTFFIRLIPQGDVLIKGCRYWGKKIILGNLNNQSFNDIWFSKKSDENL